MIYLILFMACTVYALRRLGRKVPVCHDCGDRWCNMGGGKCAFDYDLS